MRKKDHEFEPGLEYIVSLRIACTNSENLSLAKQQNPLTVENGRNCDYHFLPLSMTKETWELKKGLAHSYSAHYLGARFLVQNSFLRPSRRACPQPHHNHSSEVHIFLKLRN